LSISVIYIGTVTVQTTSEIHGAQERDWTVGRPISKPNSELWFKTDNSIERRHCLVFTECHLRRLEADDRGLGRRGDVVTGSGSVALFVRRS